MVIEMKKTIVVVCAIATVTSAVGCAASQQTTARERRALQHASAEIPFLRDFPRTPGTAPCAIHPGGLQPPGAVFHGSCTTRIAGRSANGQMRVVFSERFHGFSASSPMRSGRFTVTLSPTGHVLKIDATGQTPQTAR
jgi:hypothetical protein